MNLKKIINSPALLIVVLLFIAFTPYIFTQWIDTGFDKKGEIGDTIGGITAPFINVFAAILVYLAFKEQIKANNLIKEQIYFQHIESQIERLEDKSFDMIEIKRKTETLLLSNAGAIHTDYFDGEGNRIKYKVDVDAINKLTYIVGTFSQMFSLITNSDFNKDFLIQRVMNLYITHYEKPIEDIVNKLKPVKHLKCEHETQVLYLIKTTDLMLMNIRKMKISSILLPQ